jgi:predicted transcriptional regulator
MRFVLILLSIFSLALSNSVVAQSSGESTATADDINKTKVLVLATHHINSYEEDFSPTLLDSLINVLKGYSPTIIGMEVLPGAQIAEMERRGGPYDSWLISFAREQLEYGPKAQEALDISWRKANMTADSLLGKVQNAQEIADSTRLELINHLIASYRLHTAALQWSYLSEEVQSNQSVIPKSTAKALSETINSADETASISLRLANQLDLQRVYPIDDHLDKDSFYSKNDTQLDEALNDSTVQALRNASYLVKQGDLLEQGIEDSTWLSLYKYMNSPAYYDQDKEKQWRNIFLETSKEPLHSRLALWEERNLKIAAHIRSATAREPGGRVLITIGASHKAFLDSYLKEMMGIEVVHLSDLIEN